ncbi:MAG: hypothetical protein CMP61_07880 [Flavobacteriales bacterium]|nr:hypothetical protein [Flavobacteriales bacterium]|tara:strand:- start:31905 stop:33581 length:1677 start_codon:yes stop_codon:yes gene_type:complete
MKLSLSIFIVLISLTLSGQKLLYKSEDFIPKIPFQDAHPSYSFSNSFPLKDGRFLALREDKYNSWRKTKLFVVESGGKSRDRIKIHKLLKKKYSNVKINWIQNLNDQDLGIFFSVVNTKLKKRSFYFSRFSKQDFQLFENDILLDEYSESSDFFYKFNYRKFVTNCENHIIFQNVVEKYNRRKNDYSKHNTLVRNIAFNLNDFSVKKQIYTRNQDISSISSGLHINKQGVIYDFFISRNIKDSVVKDESYLVVTSNKKSKIIKKNIDFVAMDAKFIEFENSKIIINIGINTNPKGEFPNVEAIYEATIDENGDFKEEKISSLSNPNIQNMPLLDYLKEQKRGFSGLISVSKKWGDSRFIPINKWFGGYTYRTSDKTIWITETPLKTIVKIYSKNGDLLCNKFIKKGNENERGINTTIFNKRDHSYTLANTQANRYFIKDGKFYILQPGLFLKEIYSQSLLYILKNIIFEGNKYKKQIVSANLLVIEMNRLLQPENFDVSSLYFNDHKLNRNNNILNKSIYDSNSIMINDISGELIIPCYKYKWWRGYHYSLVTYQIVQ